MWVEARGKSTFTLIYLLQDVVRELQREWGVGGGSWIMLQIAIRQDYDSNLTVQVKKKKKHKKKLKFQFKHALLKLCYSHLVPLIYLPNCTQPGLLRDWHAQILHGAVVSLYYEQFLKTSPTLIGSRNTAFGVANKLDI